MTYSVLPNLIALAILVAVFRAILRQGTTQRLHLWLAGWILVLAHFVAQFLDPGTGTWGRVASAVELDALLLAAVAFLISVASIVESDRRRQLSLAAAVAIPSIVYTNAVIWDVAARSFYYGTLAVGVVGTAAVFCRYYGRLTVYAVNFLSGLLLVALGIAFAVARGAPELGIIVILACLNFVVWHFVLAPLPARYSWSIDHGGRLRLVGSGVSGFYPAGDVCSRGQDRRRGMEHSQVPGGRGNDSDAAGRPDYPQQVSGLSR